ncbi:hypothetical protein RSAG8_10179, partial [Rhizoctonia solani AG-8 WAC10335]
MIGREGSAFGNYLPSAGSPRHLCLVPNFRTVTLTRLRYTVTFLCSPRAPTRSRQGILRQTTSAKHTAKMAMQHVIQDKSAGFRHCGDKANHYGLPERPYSTNIRALQA